MELSNLASVMFNDVVNDTQICYHLVYPKFFNLVKRQKKIPHTIGLVKKRRRRGRPRKEEAKQFDEARRPPEDNPNDDKPDENVVQLACSRTRSGRVSRPPKHMSKFIDSRVSAATDLNACVTPMDTTENEGSFNVVQQSDIAKAIKVAPEPRKVRKNVDRFTCAVCKKVGLIKISLLD